MISRKEYGYMVAVKSREISKTPLEEVAGKLKTVDPKAPSSRRRAFSASASATSRFHKPSDL